ncbi:hypothetical protein CI1B_32080 [Bradyrhizobium ivorense]|uniref:Uncharacterized protein n=1 Tax=Bradyrhizobium ivorense TaxID=2511166 RepID=A0A508T9K7_9BRAD|nr:hypothetical protein CI1B_32080 [Bradyrhizobium ivorense]VIO79232.1 hypothetical protein CI41S_68000 [Bradyrhizobium ivorense]
MAHAIGNAIDEKDSLYFLPRGSPKASHSILARLPAV